MKTTQSATTGWFLYALILRLVANGVSTAIGVCKSTGASRGNVRYILRDMHGQGLVHVCDWVKVGPKGQLVRSYAFGPGQDAAMPANSRSGAPSRHSSLTAAPMLPRPEMIAFVSILRELRAEACTTQILAERCGVNRSFLYRLVKHLHELRLIFVADWEVPLMLARPVAMYRLGLNRPDVKRKPVQTPEARRQRRILGRAAREQMLAVTHALAGSANSSKFPIAA